MKKLLILFVSAILLTACDCPYAEYDKSPYYPTRGLTFTEEDLYGTWQSSNLKFGNKSVKEFVITRQKRGYANVNLQEEPYTRRWNETYKYVLDGKFLYFQSINRDKYGQYDGPYKFKIIEFMTCEVILQDCYNGKKCTIAFRSTDSGF